MSQQQDPELPAFSRAEVLSVMSGLMLAMFLASLDQTIVATSLSSIATDLNGWQLMSWVVSAYLVASTITTPIYGRLSDLFGRRPVLLLSISLFVGASVLCALSRTMPELIGARVLQGLGGGGLRAVSMAVVADVIPPRERGRYQGYFSSVFAMSNAFGPVLGGFFVDTLSWHWIFWINLPLGAAAFLLCNHHLARLRVPSARPAIDWLGALLILASTTPVLIGVSNAEGAGGWLAPVAYAPILVGLLFTVALILRERVAPEPMLPLRLFGNRVFTVTSLVVLLVSAALVGLIILVPLDYQLVGSLSAEDAGARLIPLTLGTVVGSAAAGTLVSRTGQYRIFLIIGTASATLICAAIAHWGLGSSARFDLVATGLLGTAIGCQFSPSSVAVQNGLSWQDTGIGMSCLMFFRLIGGAFGVALLSTVLIGSLTAAALGVPGHAVLGANPGFALFHLEQPGSHLPPALLAALSAVIRRSFTHVFWVATVLLGLSCAGCWALEEIPLRGAQEQPGTAAVSGSWQGGEG